MSIIPIGAVLALTVTIGFTVEEAAALTSFSTTKSFKVAATVSNGFRNLSSETPIGFCSKNVQRLYVTPYKYDGKEYQPQQLIADCRAFTPTP